MIMMMVIVVEQWGFKAGRQVENKKKLGFGLMGGRGKHWEAIIGAQAASSVSQLSRMQECIFEPYGETPGSHLDPIVA